MKKISVFLLLLAGGILLMGSGYAAPLRPAILGGAYDDLLPQAVKGKTFVPSFNIRWEYDDNVYAGDGSWKLYLEPKLDVHSTTPTTYFGLSYQYSFLWYNDRPDDDTDMAHDVTIDLRHYFSPRVEIAVRDAFRFTEEPASPSCGRYHGYDYYSDGGIYHEDGLRELSYLSRGNYYYNQGSVGLNIQASRLLWLNLSYANLLVKYDDRGASKELDRMTQAIAARFQYLASPQSKINLGGIYKDTDYDTARKDSQGWVGYVGLDQQVAKRAIASIFAGWENREFKCSSEDAPYAGISLRAGLGVKSNGVIGYRYGLSETEWKDFSVEKVHSFYGGLNAWLAKWTSVHVNTSYELGDLVTKGDGGSIDQNVWLLGLVLRQHVHRDLYFEVGYRRTDVNGDVPVTDYERNRYYVGFGGIF